MKEEILIAKRILKDPNLSHHATRKFNVTIDKHDETNFMVTGAEIKALVEKTDAKEDQYEVELHMPPNRNLMPGTTMKLNSELPASELTKKNMFKKLNYS